MESKNNFILITCKEIHFFSKELTLKETHDVDVMLNSGNCSDIQMAMQTDHFVDRTFRRSN